MRERAAAETRPQNAMEGEEDPMMAPPEDQMMMWRSVYDFAQAKLVKSKLIIAVKIYD